MSRVSRVTSQACEWFRIQFHEQQCPRKRNRLTSKMHFSLARIPAISRNVSRCQIAGLLKRHDTNSRKWFTTTPSYGTTYKEIIADSRTYWRVRNVAVCSQASQQALIATNNDVTASRESYNRQIKKRQREINHYLLTFYHTFPSFSRITNCSLHSNHVPSDVSWKSREMRPYAHAHAQRI